MSISAEVPETVYVLTAANLGPFSTVWTYVNPSDVTAMLDPGTGVLQALDQGVDYLLVGLTPTVNGGQCTLSASLLAGAAAWTAGATIVFARDSTTATDTNWGSSLDFDPQTAAQSIDGVARKVQEVVSAVQRSLSLPVGQTGQTLDLAGVDGMILAVSGGKIVPIAPPAGAGLATFDLSNVDPQTGRAALVADFINDARQSGASGQVGAEDATPKINAALNVAPLGRTASLRTGQYRFDETLTSLGPISLLGGGGMGAGPGAVLNDHCAQIVANFAAGDLLHVGPSLYGSDVRGLQFNSQVGTRTAGAAIHLDATGLGSSNYNHRLTDLSFNNQFVDLQLTNCGIGEIHGTYHQAWSYAAVYAIGDGVHEGSSGSLAANVFFGDTTTGTAQGSALEIHHGYSRVTNNLTLGARIGCKWVVDTYPAGAFEYCGNWTEEQDVAGFYGVSANGQAASMLAVSWGEYSNASRGPSNYPNFQASIALVPAGAPWLSLSQVIGNRVRNSVGEPGAAAIYAGTGDRLQVSTNNLEGLGGNTTVGVFIGAQATHVDCFDNKVYGAFSARYLINNAEVHFRDFSSRLLAAEINALTVRNGSTAWCEDGTPGSHPLTGGGPGCIAVRAGGAWVGKYDLQQTGWTAATGTPNKGAYNADALGALPIGAAYSQAQVQALQTACSALSQRVLALEQALRTKGDIN